MAQQVKPLFIFSFKHEKIPQKIQIIHLQMAYISQKSLQIRSQK